MTSTPYNVHAVIVTILSSIPCVLNNTRKKGVKNLPFLPQSGLQVINFFLSLLSFSFQHRWSAFVCSSVLLTSGEKAIPQNNLTFDDEAVCIQINRRIKPIAIDYNYVHVSPFFNMPSSFFNFIRCYFLHSSLDWIHSENNHGKKVYGKMFAKERRN